MRRHCLAVFLGLVALDCGGIARTNGNDLCLAGERIECTCRGPGKGVRTCSADGIAFGECVCGGGLMDAGGGIDDDGGPPTNTCSSKSAWTGGLQGSADMTPGRPCIACHLTVPQSPQYTVAGTVYGDVADADDCNGVDGLGVAIAVMDERGAEIVPRLLVNRVGNFVGSRAMPAAYRVKIVASGVERVMQSLVMNGDCNVCHTATGAQGASGRVVKPKP